MATGKSLSTGKRKSTKLAVIWLGDISQPLCRLPSHPNSSGPWWLTTIRHLSLIKAGCDMGVRHTTTTSRATLVCTVFWRHSLPLRRSVTQPNSSKMAVIWLYNITQSFLRMGHRPFLCIISIVDLLMVSLNRPHQSGCDMKDVGHFTSALTG